MSVDSLIDQVHWLVRVLQQVVPYYQRLTCMQFPHASIFTLGANAINGATAVFAANAGKPRQYWLHSLVSVVIGAFGGGTMAPLLIGRPSMIVANDQIIVLCAIAWYATQYLGMQPFFQFLPVRLFWTFFLGLFRTHSVVNVVVAASEVLKPTIYYPVPIVGPIVVGTALGCMGQFLPFEKGLAPIKNGTPWNLQGALMTASFYHIMIHDKTGFLGTGLRSMVGTYDSLQTKMIIATFQIISLELQVLFNGDANIFTPLHKLLYLLFQVQGPVPATPAVEKDCAGWSKPLRERLAFLLAWGKGLFLVGFLVSLVHWYSPLHALPSHRVALVSQSQIAIQRAVLSDSIVDSISAQLRRDTLVNHGLLRVGESLGACQVASQWQGCSPHWLRLEEDLTSEGSTCSAPDRDDEKASAEAVCSVGGYRLAVYKGSALNTEEFSGAALTWSLPMPLSQPAEGFVRLLLSEEGQIFLVSLPAGMKGEYSTTNPFEPGTMSVLWTNGKAFCNSSNSSGRGAHLRVSAVEGKGEVVCGDGSTHFI